MVRPNRLASSSKLQTSSFMLQASSCLPPASCFRFPVSSCPLKIVDCGPESILTLQPTTTQNAAWNISSRPMRFSFFTQSSNGLDLITRWILNLRRRDIKDFFVCLFVGCCLVVFRFFFCLTWLLAPVKHLVRFKNDCPNRITLQQKKNIYIYKVEDFCAGYKRSTQETCRKIPEFHPHTYTHTHTHTHARMYISILIHLNRKFFLIRDNDGEEGGSAGWKKRRQEKKFLLPPQPREREREREREGEGEGKKEARICMTSSQS